MPVGLHTPTPLGWRALELLYRAGPLSQGRLARLLWPPNAGWREERREGAVARAMRWLELAGLVEEVRRFVPGCLEVREWQVSRTGEFVAGKRVRRNQAREERAARR